LFYSCRSLLLRTLVVAVLAAQFDIHPSTRVIPSDERTMESPNRMPPLVVTSVAIVGIIWVLMVLGIRLYLRCKLNGPIGKDDYAAILATTLGIAQSALVLTSVNSGLGRQHPSVQDDLIDDDKIAKASLSPSFSIDQTQTKKTRWHMSKTDSIIFGLSSLAMPRLSCILQRLTSPELRVTCCKSA
jgi:hypothetical protein